MSREVSARLTDADRTKSSQLEVALARFAELQDAGQAPDQETFLAEYPECAGELKECLHQLDLLGGLARVIRADRKQASPDFVLGDFRLLRQIARGGMGIVYEGVQCSTGGKVAIKMLPAIASIDPKAVQRFRNEVQAATLLDHPNIVNVLEAGNHEGIDFYAMRYIHGRTLAQILQELRTRSKLPGFRMPTTPTDLARSERSPVEKLAGDSSESHARAIVALTDSAETSTQVTASDFDPCYFRLIAGIAIQALEGLEHAHQQGVLHRDIKPSNLLLDENGHLWILDFGLARIEQSDTLTQTGDWLGTLRYMSPELLAARHSVVDHRNDIYSLGATLYEALTLVPLVSGGNRAEVMQKLLHQHPTPLRRIQRRIPADLETIVLKAISREKEDRYTSCAEMAEDLKCFLANRRIVARRPGITQQVLHWAQRNQETAVVGVFFTVLLLAFGFTSIWWISAARHSAMIEQSQRLVQEQAARSAEEALRMHRDVSRTIQAAKAWQNSDYEFADELLSQPLLNKQNFPLRILRELAVLTPSVVATTEGGIYCVRISPDEQLLAAAGETGVRIQHRTSRALIRQLTDHEGDVNSIVWSADGAQLATCGDDGQLNVYNTSDWSRRTLCVVQGAIVMAAFSDVTGKIAFCERVLDRNGITCGQNAFHIIDATDGRAIFEDRSFGERPEGLDVSPDGRKIAVVDCHAILRLYDLEKLKLEWTAHLNPAEGQPFQASCVAFAHTLPLMVAGCRGNVLRVFDYETKEIIQDLPESRAVEGIGFSPDDRAIVATSRKKQTLIWEVSAAGNWTHVGDFRCSQPVWTCDVLSDGSIFVGGEDGKIELFNRFLFPDRQRIRVIANDEFHQASFQDFSRAPVVNETPSRAFEFAARRNSSLRSSTSELPDGESSTITAMAEIPRSNRWVFGLNTTADLGMFDVLRGDLSLAVRLREQGAVNAIDSSADGRFIIVASGRRIMQLDAKSLQTLATTELQTSESIRSLSYSDDGKSVFVCNTGLYDQVAPSPITKLDARTLQQLATPERRFLLHARHHPSYSAGTLRYLTTLPDQFCNTEPGKSLLQEKATHVAVSEDRSAMILVHGRSTVYVYHNESWEEPLIIHLGAASVTDVDLSPDGSTIAVGANDRVTLIQTLTGRELYDLRTGMIELHSLRFSNDGNLLIAGGQGLSGEPEILVWGNSWSSAK